MGLWPGPSGPGFTGEQHDSLTGNLYLRARYLMPGIGRFSSADSVQPNAPGSQGYNRYSYVANNPTTWIDPTGQQAALRSITLNPNFLWIATQIAAFFIAQACARVGTLCGSSLFWVGAAIILVLIIMACVLGAFGEACWITGTVTQDRTISDTVTQTDPAPNPEPTAEPREPDPIPAPEPRRSCASDYPWLIPCKQLPPRYVYKDVSEALAVMKQTLGMPHLRPHPRNGREATSGPCSKYGPYSAGKHYNVLGGGGSEGSIGECTCCSDSGGPPREETRCAILNMSDPQIR